MGSARLRRARHHVGRRPGVPGTAGAFAPIPLPTRMRPGADDETKTDDSYLIGPVSELAARAEGTRASRRDGASIIRDREAPGLEARAPDQTPPYSWRLCATR